MAASSEMEQIKSTNRILIVVIIIAAFFLGSFVNQTSQKNGSLGTTAPAPNPSAPSAPTAPAKVAVDVGHLPVLGNKNAKVTLVEFADFRCPFCEKFFTDTFPQIKKDYIDTGKVQFAFRHFAFLGQQSTWAAEASECANEQGKFWDYHDYLYKNQAPESDLAYYSKENLILYAGKVGLDTINFASCLNSDKYAKPVADDLAAGQKAGVNGTPAVFVNGQLIVGAQPFDAFKTAIDSALK